MKHTTWFVGAVATTLLVAPAMAQTPQSAATTMKEEKPGLLQKAKITAAAATSTAEAQVPKGKIVSAEIETERGKLIFSFDLRTKGKSGIDEVTVDARNGRVLSVNHETPRDEAREKAADKKAKP